MNATHRGPKASTEVRSEPVKPVPTEQRGGSIYPKASSLYYFIDSNSKVWGFSLGHPFDPFGFVIGDQDYGSLEDLQAAYVVRTGDADSQWVQLVILAPQ